MFTQYIGELAGIGTSIAFAFGSTLFTISGRELGSPLVNRTRLVIALIGVLIVHLVWFGEFLPLDAGFQPWFWLGISGFVGLALGDALLFQAFVMVGPRISMLIMALAPVLGAILAWIFLGEILRPIDILAIVVTIGGIALVVTERQTVKNKNTVVGSHGARKIPDAEQIIHEDDEIVIENNEDNSQRYYIYGLLFALGGAMGQAGGQVLAKIGLANDFPTFSALLIRIIAATITMWVITVIRGEVISSYRDLRANPRAVGLLGIAALIGPILGVWLSLVAVQNSPIGVATTLSSLTPIFLIPIAYFVFGDKVTKQAVIGTLIAVGGSVLLFL